MTSYFFGVEIEVIVEPHNNRQPVQKPVKDELDLWFGKIAKALRNRRGCDGNPLEAKAQIQRSQYRETQHRQHTWWITWDGSLVSPDWPKHPGVPFEAVSPKLDTRRGWELEIDAFWDAMRAVFHMPRRMLRCGSHVHVSPTRGTFQLEELKAIAFGVVFYDEQVQQILPQSRRNHIYCVPNKRHSRRLRGKSMTEVAQSIRSARDKKQVVEIVQGLSKDDRPVLWNFHNVTAMPFTNEAPIGTVEFRGGRCLRGPVRTKRWISFAVAFIILAIQKFKHGPRGPFASITSIEFWGEIRKAAQNQGMAQHLPIKYTTMNETDRSDITDDPGDDYPFDPPSNHFVSQSADNSDNES